MEEILFHIIKHYGLEIEIEIVPELVRKNDIPDSYGDNSRLKEDLNWHPETAFFDALESIL